jgi:hypothetical protein
MDDDKRVFNFRDLLLVQGIAVLLVVAFFTLVILVSRALPKDCLVDGCTVTLREGATVDVNSFESVRLVNVGDGFATVDTFHRGGCKPTVMDRCDHPEPGRITQGGSERGRDGIRVRLDWTSKSAHAAKLTLTDNSEPPTIDQPPDQNPPEGPPIPPD